MAERGSERRRRAGELNSQSDFDAVDVIVVTGIGMFRIYIYMSRDCVWSGPTRGFDVCGRRKGKWTVVLFG